MTQRFRTQMLYLALVLYAAAALAYWGVTATSLEAQYWHADRWSQLPFDLDDISLKVTSVAPSAAAAGLRVGDVLEDVDGAPYRGMAEWLSLRRRPPGEKVEITVRQPGIAGDVDRTFAIPLEPHPPTPAPSLSGWIVALSVQVIPPLISLLIGLWVAAVRPRDGNAWLLLLLLTYPEVFFLNPYALSGGWLAFADFWFYAVQIPGDTSLLLFGMFFPERWRLDREAPWLKYGLVALTLGGFALIYRAHYCSFFHPQGSATAAALAHLASPWLTAVNLFSLLLYLAAIFDKLRSASTADARRRLRVLFAGSVVGLGSVLALTFSHVPVFHAGSRPWIDAAAALLFLIFPFTLAYVVLVQRAMDVRILLRMGTKYALARAVVLVARMVIAAFIVINVLVPMLQRGEHRPVDILALGAVAIWLMRTFTTRKPFLARVQEWVDRKFFREAYDAELVLNELSEEVRRITEPESLVSTVSRRITDVLHVPQVALLLDGGAKCFELPASNGAGPFRLSANSYTVRNLRRANGPVTLYRENPDGWFLLADDEEREVLDRLRAELLLPVQGRDRLMGVLSLSAKRSEAPYTSSDLRLLQNVATQAGLALEISELGRSLAREAGERERIHREIEIAREVQQRLFPQTIPEAPGATLAGYCRPAQGVGGDYYDLIRFGDGRLGIAIGDVSGKGISAALLMASLRASLRGMTMDGPGDLERVMSKVNRLVYEASASNRYATFFFAAYDPATRHLRYVNAGHNPPVVIRGVRSDPGAPDIVRLTAGGPVVGLMEDATFEEDSVRLEPGDLLLAYTDGISEAMTAAEEEWGEERMLAAACGVADADADAVLRCVFDAADAFAAGAPQFDDMTLVVLKMNQAALAAAQLPAQAAAG